MISALKALIGVEHSLEEVCYALKNQIQDIGPTVVGAHQINCSDESERECVELFHRIIAREMLPELKYWSRSSFRTVNLGCRYEVGSVAVAEDHYATTEAKRGFKVLLVKMNSHVSMVDGTDGPIFGHMPRYDKQSVYCGALHAMLDGVSAGFVDELADVFRTGGIDRLAILRDSERVPKRNRGLFAAAVNARLQADRAMADVMAITSVSPTVYLVVPAITLNRESADTELVVGVGVIDERGGKRTRKFVGLGDDPGEYALATSLTRLRLSDHVYQH